MKIKLVFFALLAYFKCLSIKFISCYEKNLYKLVMYWTFQIFNVRRGFWSSCVFWNAVATWKTQKKKKLHISQNKVGLLHPLDGYLLEIK